MGSLLKLKECDVNEATYVKNSRGEIKKIASKWGLHDWPRVPKPSEGGYGVTTVDGETVGMMFARSYYKENK